MTGIRIIGLGGTNGAGKDAVGELLAAKYNYLFVSVTELLRHEAERRGLPVERQHLRAISAEWRHQNGLGVLVDRAVEMFETAGDRYKGVIMASLRNPGEADRVHELDGTMVWIDADPQIRFERIRHAHRGREGEDDVTFEQFLQQEAEEMHRQSGGDAASLDGASVKVRCDIVIMNNSSNIADLEAQVVKALGLA